METRMLTTARPQGKMEFYQLVLYPKYVRKIKDRKLRRNLYRYMAHNKKMRIGKFKKKHIGKYFDLFKKNISRDEFNRQYELSWDLSSSYSSIDGSSSGSGREVSNKR